MSIQDRVKHLFVLMLETVLTARSGDGPYITWRSGPAAGSVARSRHNPDYAARVRSSSARPGSFPSAFHDIPVQSAEPPTSRGTIQQHRRRRGRTWFGTTRLLHSAVEISTIGEGESEQLGLGACLLSIGRHRHEAPALPASASGISAPASPRITPTSHELQRLH